MAIHGHTGGSTQSTGSANSVRGIGVGDTVEHSDHPDDCEVVGVGSKAGIVGLKNKRTGQKAHVSAAAIINSPKMRVKK